MVTIAAVVAGLGRLGARSAAAQVPAATQGCGVLAPGIDVATQLRIERALARKPSNWFVRPLLVSSTPSTRTLELLGDGDGRKLTLVVSYLSSPKDAELALQCHLKTIQTPRYKPIAGLGDKAFVLTKAHLRIQIDAIELSIDSKNESLTTERAVAEVVIAAIRLKP